MLNLKIHNKNHILKSLLGNAEFLINGLKLKNDELYVVNFHGTQKQFIPDFRKQIEFFQRTFEIISPSQVTEFYNKGILRNKPLLLLTFDDGIKNNLRAASVLNEFNIKAYFFVIPDFINTQKEDQQRYFLKNIRPVTSNDLDANEEDYQSLSWDDIKALLMNGHGVGSHTKTHTLIAEGSDLTNSIREIKESKEVINNSTGTKIDSFCSINNTLESVAQKEYDLIVKNYRFHYTTLPGPNKQTDNPYFIKRCNIETHWLPGAVKFALGKWDLRRWKKSKEKFEQIVASTNPSFSSP